MSPLAPYKLERSAKARARQAFSTMHWTPFKTLQRKSVNWCKLTPFKTPVCLYMGHNPFMLTPFKTPVQIQDSFQDPCLYTALNCSNWLLSRPLHCSMGNYLQIDSVKSPWETSFNKIGSFKTISHSESWTHFKTLASLKQSFHSPWETSWKKLILSGPFYTVNFGFLSRPLWLIHHIQWMDSFQDHSEEEKKTEHTAVQF